MRAALHVPDQPPEKLPPMSGPGRNDAFGLLSAGLFGEPQPYSPVKFGVVWNVENRKWGALGWELYGIRCRAKWNLLAAVGLGAPLIGGHKAVMDFSLVKRQTDISEQIRAPKYPWAIDAAMAARGEKLYATNCASCHEGVEDDSRLHGA